MSYDDRHYYRLFGETKAEFEQREYHDLAAQTASLLRLMDDHNKSEYWLADRNGKVLCRTGDITTAIKIADDCETVTGKKFSVIKVTAVSDHELQARRKV